jgi:tRNA dimethylallyltransferase
MGKNGKKLLALKKLLVICGPTATGKTDLALHFRKALGGVLISADSRQVYKYMDIGTGKDIKKVGEIYGYDLVNPNEDFNVSDYAKYARRKIKEIWEENKLPILVGGTGLYIKAVIDGMETLDIPRDEKLRNNLKDKSAIRLYNLLVGLDPIKAASMNSSDVKNPRRLIRAIEIASGHGKKKKTSLKADVLWIGLMLSKELENKRIESRVDERIKRGFAKEITFLIKHNYMDYVPSKTLGYREWPDIAKWKKEEIKYAKRQLVWFKKEKRIHWFDVGRDYQKEIEILVEKWYATGNAKKN